MSEDTWTSSGSGNGGSDLIGNSLEAFLPYHDNSSEDEVFEEYDDNFQTCFETMSGVVDIYGTTPRLGRRSMALADIDPKYVSQSAIWEASEVETSRGSIRIQHLTALSAGPRPLSCSVTSGNVGPLNHSARFPKLEECAHFHYDVLELPSLKINLRNDEAFKYSGSGSGEDAADKYSFSIEVVSGGQCWLIRRTHANLCKLDEQLHRCVWDRSFSQLERVSKGIDGDCGSEEECKGLTQRYFHRLSELPTNQITCGSVLSFFEIDNRGRHIVSSDDSAINTPAVAAACAVRKYVAQAADELSFEVGDMISVIDMPPPEESIWWRGKRKFHVGFFPRECVQVIGEKVPMGLPIVPSTTKLQRLSVTSAASVSSGSSNSPEKPVLKKNGKLISFFRSFILSRPSKSSLRQSGILRQRVFSCDLAEHLLNTGTDIPVVLKTCSEFIETYGIVDGIYRLSGITSNIQKLRNAFDEDKVPNLEEDNAIKQDIHAVSSLLKMYFRELPNPLCTYQLYEKFVAAAQSSDEERLLRMREVAQELPPPHFRTLEYLLKHLARVAQNSDQTGMTPKNMAIVWAPNLIRCKELEAGGVAALKGIGVQAVVTEYLVRFADQIFSDKIRSDFPETTSVIGNSSPTGRPNSLAITSSPMRLVSLGEAQDKLRDDRAYIDVGGGPSNLPPKYHTVIDIPGRRSSMKSKRTATGWKTFFSRNRSFSKPPRKGPNPDITVVTKSTPPIVQQGLQPTWVGRLRPHKSVESLVSSPLYQSAGGCSGGLSNTLEVDESELEEVDVHPYTQSSPTSPVETCDHAPAAGPEEELDNDPNSDARALQNSKTHNRSISHDSYFEFGEFLKKNGVFIGETLEEENSRTTSKASLDNMSSEMDESTGTSPRKEQRSSGAFGDCESASMSSPRNTNRVSFGSPMTPPTSIPSLLRLPQGGHGMDMHSSSSDEFTTTSNTTYVRDNESKSPLLKPKPRYSLLRNMESQTSMTKLTDIGVSTGEDLTTTNAHIMINAEVQTFQEIGGRFELDRNSSVDNSSTDTTPGGEPFTNIIYSPLINESGSSASAASSVEKLFSPRDQTRIPVPTGSLFVCPLYEAGVHEDKDKFGSESRDSTSSMKCYKTRIQQYENLGRIMDSFSEEEPDAEQSPEKQVGITNTYENERLYQNDEFQQSQISIVKLEGSAQAESETKDASEDNQNFYENWQGQGNDGEDEDGEEVENSYEAVIYEDVGNQYENGEEEDCYETIEAVKLAHQVQMEAAEAKAQQKQQTLPDYEEESEADYEDVRYVNLAKDEASKNELDLSLTIHKIEIISNEDKTGEPMKNSASKDSLANSVQSPSGSQGKDADSSPSFTDDMVTYLEIQGTSDNIKLRNDSIDEQESIRVTKQSSFSSEGTPTTEESSEIRHIDSPLVVDNPLYGLQQLDELEANGNFLKSQGLKPLEKLVVRCNSAPAADGETSNAGRDFALELAIRTINAVQDGNKSESHSLNINTNGETQKLQLFKRMSEPSLLFNKTEDNKAATAAWKLTDAKRLTHRKSSVKELLSKFETKDSLSPSPSPTHSGSFASGPGLPRPDSRSNASTLRQRNNANNSPRFQHHRFSVGDILMTQSMSSAEDNGSSSIGSMVRSDTFPELRTDPTKENGNNGEESGTCSDNYEDCGSNSDKSQALRVAMSSVDMNDPSTRERIEKIKEERRIYLRQKISSELTEPPKMSISFSSDSKCSLASLKSPDRSSFSSMENDCVFPPPPKIPEDPKKSNSTESPRKRAFSEDVDISPGSCSSNQTKSIKTDQALLCSLVEGGGGSLTNSKMEEVNVREKVAQWSTAERKIYSHSTSSFTEIVGKTKPGLKESTSLPVDGFELEGKQSHQMLFRREITPGSLDITNTKKLAGNRSGGTDSTAAGKKIKDMAAFFERKQF